MGRWVTRNLLIAQSCILCAALLGCGPITSTVTLHDAGIAIEQARMEQAETYAVYEIVSAIEYLEKAREEWGSSDFQHAEKYAQRALDFAIAARDRAVSLLRQGSGAVQTGIRR
ncbi:MAG: DUF4398 domain-containing protein [Bradymonadales bacterium]|nr:DUF4398 domain-containing protein [Bradymonadales bacterium]